MTAREDHPRRGMCDSVGGSTPHQQGHACVHWRPEDQPRPTPPDWPRETEGPWHAKVEPGAHPSQDARLFALLLKICRNAYACAYQQNTFPGQSDPCGQCANCMADEVLGANWKLTGGSTPSPKATLPVGVSVLMTKGNQVLLGKRKNNSAAGLYSTPGGRLEQSEDMLQCAFREVKEETGVILGSVRILDFREHFRYGNHYVMFYAHATEWEGEVVNTEPDKCESWEWFDLDKIPDNCTEPAEILKLLIGSTPSPDPPQQSALTWNSDLDEEWKKAKAWMHANGAYVAKCMEEDDLDCLLADYAIDYNAALMAQHREDVTRLLAEKRAEIARLHEADKIRVQDICKYTRQRDEERAAHDKIGEYLLPLVGTGDGTSVDAAKRAAGEIERLREALRVAQEKR